MDVELSGIYVRLHCGLSTRKVQSYRSFLTTSCFEYCVAEEHVHFITTNTVLKSVALIDIINATKSDEVLMATRNTVITGHWKSVSDKCSAQHQGELASVEKWTDCTLIYQIFHPAYLIVARNPRGLSSSSPGQYLAPAWHLKRHSTSWPQGISDILVWAAAQTVRAGHRKQKRQASMLLASS